MTVSHLWYDIKYITMPKKIIVYGDSFSNPTCCKTKCDKMWYRHLSPEHAKADVINRARAGNNTAHMFLEATHDCVTNQHPIHMLVGLGPLQRLPKYTDKWYHEEFIKPTEQPGLRDYLEYMQSHTPSDIELMNNEKGRTLVDPLVDMYHPTLLWSNLYKNIIGLDCLARKHGHHLLVVHMHHTEYEHHREHPLVAPLERTAKQCNYVDHQHSCHSVCKHADIRPWDFDTYGAHGHHSAEGQAFFGTHIKRLLAGEE